MRTIAPFGGLLKPHESLVWLWSSPFAVQAREGEGNARRYMVRLRRLAPELVRFREVLCDPVAITVRLSEGVASLAVTRCGLVTGWCVCVEFQR